MIADKANLTAKLTVFGKGPMTKSVRGGESLESGVGS